jgi:hypothetical protein
MRPAAKIVNIFAAWFSNFAIRMIFDSPFNELVMHSHHRILVPLIGKSLKAALPSLSSSNRTTRRSTVGYPGHSIAEGLGRFEFLLIS